MLIFKEILCFVWNRILRSEDGDEIKKNSLSGNE